MGRREKLRLGFVLALGVVVPGLAKYGLTSAGYPAVGSAIWATGYLTAVILVWYVWVRPVDFRGAGG